jgi:hypothetical protein
VVPHLSDHRGLTFGRAEVMNKVKVYRAVLLLSIISNLVVGVIIFVSPDTFANFAGQPEAFPKTWPRHWGAQLWAINFCTYRAIAIRSGINGQTGWELSSASPLRCSFSARATGSFRWESGTVYQVFCCSSRTCPWLEAPQPCRRSGNLTLT